jgi:hypothetical protein
MQPKESSALSFGSFVSVSAATISVVGFLLLADHFGRPAWVPAASTDDGWLVYWPGLLFAGGAGVVAAFIMLERYRKPIRAVMCGLATLLLACVLNFFGLGIALGASGAFQ